MLTPKIKIGKVNGVDFNITGGWIFIFILLSYTLKNPESYARYLELINLLTLGKVTLDPAFPHSQPIMLLFTITVLIGIYLSVILHEIGHATMARRTGINVKSITLWVGGGVAEIETIPSVKELPITIAGPTVTAIIVPAYAVISASLFTLNLVNIAWVFLLLALFNLLILIVNLLPLFPLDGGRIFRATLTHKINNYLKATKYAFYTTLTVIITAIGLMITFNNYDYLLISGIVGLLASLSYKNFQQTYNPENIAQPSDFYIYDHTFAFDSETITRTEEENLTTNIIKQGGHTTQNDNEADYIVSKEPLKSQRKLHTKNIHPLLLVQRLNQNGANIPQEFENQFKI